MADYGNEPSLEWTSAHERAEREGLDRALKNRQGLWHRRVPVADVEQDAANTITPYQVTDPVNADHLRSKVFDTAELLENILRLLPYSSVYHAYRVCRQWRDLVDTSVLLKQKLYLKPCARKQVWQMGFGEEEFCPPQWRYVDDETTVQVGPENWLELLEEAGLPSTHTVVPIRLHPFLRIDNGCRARQPSSGERAEFNQKELTAFHISEEWLSEISLDSSRIKTSALSAYLTDPPCKQVKVTRDWQAGVVRVEDTAHRMSFETPARAWGASNVLNVMDQYDAPFKRGQMEHTVTADNGVTFRDVFVALKQPGKFYYHSWDDSPAMREYGQEHWCPDGLLVSKSGITLTQGFAMMEDERGCKDFKVIEEMSFEMTGVTIPCEEEWLYNARTLKYGEDAGFARPGYMETRKLPTRLV